MIGGSFLPGNSFWVSDDISTQEATLTAKVANSFSKGCAHWWESRRQVPGPWVLTQGWPPRCRDAH